MRSYIAGREYPAEWARSYVALQLVFGALLMALVLVPVLALIRLEAALEEARSTQVWFHSANHGWAYIVVLIGSIPASFIPAGWASRLWTPVFREYIAVRSLAEAPRLTGGIGRLTRWFFRSAISRVPSDVAPAVFLDAMNAQLVRRVGVPGTALLGVGLVLLPVDLMRYDVGREAGLERHTILGTTTIPWESVRSVSVGCYLRGDAPTGLYWLHLGDGTRISVFPSLEQVGPAGLLDLNARLRSAGVPFDVGTHDGERLMEPGCVHALASTMTMDERSLAVLLTP